MVITFESELESMVVRQRCDRAEREGTCPSCPLWHFCQVDNGFSLTVRRKASSSRHLCSPDS